jgi:predicted MFS family arabinose efflux permease
VGALLMAGGLGALLLAVSEGAQWGWASRPVVGLFGATLVLFPLWAWHELRVDRPLVRLRSLKHRDVALANISALGLGAMLFSGSSAVSQLVQTPTSTGYGFGLPLVLAGLALLPSSIGSQVSNRVVQGLLRRMSPRGLLPLGPLLIGVSMTLLVLSHAHLWEILGNTFVQGLAIGCSFVVMPTLILGAVPPDQTGSSIALNQVLRTLGGSIGSAATGAVLASATVHGSLLPSDRGYTLAFAGTAVGCALLATLLFVGPRIGRRSAPAEASPAPA